MSQITDAFGNWFAGFTDGEGCFVIGKHNNDNPHTDYRCQFAITLRDDDKEIIEEIRETLGIGNICDDPARTTPTRNKQPSSRFRVAAISECAELVKLFTTYPLRAKKRRDFDIWKTAVAEQSKPINERNPDLLEYCFLKIREVRKYERREKLTIPKIKKLQLTIEFESTTE